jgi:hypothetical protein
MEKKELKVYSQAKLGWNIGHTAHSAETTEVSLIPLRLTFLICTVGTEP